jgi:hypothetical protein
MQHDDAAPPEAWVWRNPADHAAPVWGEGRNISPANNDLAGRSKRAGHVFR